MLWEQNFPNHNITYYFKYQLSAFEIKIQLFKKKKN